MAGQVAFCSSFNLLDYGKFSKQQLFMPKSSPMLVRRGFYFESCKVSCLPSLSVRKSITPYLIKLERRSNMQSCKRCFCLASLLDADAAVTFEWVPTIDQMLLMTSIVLTYIAGVIPSEENSTLDARGKIRSGNVDTNGSSVLGSERKNDDRISIEFAWDVVKGKLMNSLSSIKRGDIGATSLESEQRHGKQPSNLSALAQGPRLRLMWTSFQLLKKEVDNISANAVTFSSGNLLAIFNDVIQTLCQPLCVTWLEEELSLRNGNTNKECLSSLVNNLNGYGVLTNIRKSGKDHLFAELICVLRFGSVRKAGFYSDSLFMEHGVSILEDLVIMLADGIASMYLELMSVDSSMSNEMNNLGLSLCTLSTRALQKLRNEVALKQWMHQNMDAVVSMYEDRFDLCTLQCHLIEESSKSKVQNVKWWEKIRVMSSQPVLSQLNTVVINQISVAVKRTKELRALTGWRYYYSLLLELADIAMPVIRTVISKLSDAISFFLVCLIGRSLGLIYTGIRQSLRWK
ncbi:uncharacterized protein LOC107824359 isoform X1 [Nicotiana tabacum]|uniref:Uncharacterized protein LOC107824359 isoform X1 n=4 Tax=Nicotiana TaxID=4085 RepID=A0AC58TSR7_TOBAC|nr:PREDICTED: uncharacterized protein LOC104234688 isoform X1 [Nicotiana sylvestris]XP_009786595.1 PREDICTED: uncharacterized protein LOC104234688 isoform X1 [Nicotiana sylvestris]XP_009786596.1 PREDICTED: uncharacterized protein LOC104234688 isoform X1 [Nicotiana sylvestris]XP_016506591.1 PREDICTED: uncharacterized protein LOC107824359 [Nicotiana tabacum]